MILKDMNEMFADDLRDPAYAAGYLNIALEDDGIEGFLYALQKVARAHGISKVAVSSDMPRESLYRALSEKGNPGIKPLARVLDSLGLCLAVTPSGPTVCAAHDDQIAERQALTDAQMPLQSIPMKDEITAFPRDREQGIAIMGNFALMREEARREQLEARQAILELQEEVRRTLAQVQQLATMTALPAPNVEGSSD